MQPDGNILLETVHVPKSVNQLRRDPTKLGKPTFLYIEYPHFQVTSAPRKEQLKKATKQPISELLKCKKITKEKDKRKNFALVLI